MGSNYDRDGMNARSAMQSTSKVPPYWEPGLELRGYPFRTWIQDLSLWAAATEVPERAMAATVAQRVGGVAKVLVREIPTDHLMNGRPCNGYNAPPVSGMQIIVTALERRYGAQETETSVASVIDLWTFRRLPRETIDDAMTRFEVIKARAEDL